MTFYQGHSKETAHETITESSLETGLPPPWFDYSIRHRCIIHVNDYRWLRTSVTRIMFCRTYSWYRTIAFCGKSLTNKTLLCTNIDIGHSENHCRVAVGDRNGCSVIVPGWAMKSELPLTAKHVTCFILVGFQIIQRSPSLNTQMQACKESSTSKCSPM